MTADEFTSRLSFEGSFDGLYGLELEPPIAGDDSLRGRLRVGPELLGAQQRLHGGVPAAIAESLASLATARIAMSRGLLPAGMSNDTTVLVAVSEGATLRAEATPEGHDSGNWVWSVALRDETDALCAFSRVTIAVRPPRER